ncbi:tetratricopeptide repeat protein [Sphingomonas sp. So64.6b]|uniref:tetratricopeptide repeat protein n=1 Tax=Sphingomonas sp. So64.6b TaxID=2997354 RepID=UPI0015FF79F8|nr:tetratricopeptide repeat protein [Sphingomonas sp. So64.6b]QNA85104.1 tetratricopeptide repeat protein [Sphingomonas sp. So64.6b]
MAIDDDNAGPLPDRVLPEPPPPNPARRQAAIDAAMRRFDGVDERPVPQGAPTRSGSTRSGSTRSGPSLSGGASPPPWWTRLGRPQLGALVSVALIALIGLPVAMVSFNDPYGPMSVPRPAAVDAPAPTSKSAGSIASPSTMIAPPPPVAPKPVFPPTLAEIPAVRTPDALTDSNADAVASAPPIAAPAMKVARDGAAPPATQTSRSELAYRAEGSAKPRLAESRFASPPGAVAPAPPPPPPPADMAAESGANEIVVTGMRRAAPVRSIGRGDWNACTVNDPGRSLAACRKQIDPAAKGAAGRAAARLADGLSQAWQGDLDGAIAAFDQAIAIEPRQPLAYLNRGLAYQRSGDLDRAIADLDRAVTYARGSARGYYNRSVLLRQRGDTRRATADEDRAVSLDLRYQAVVR